MKKEKLARLSVGWLIGAIVLTAAAIYVVVMLTLNRPHDMAWDLILLESLLFLPGALMLWLAFRPKKRVVAWIALAISAALCVLSVNLLPTRIAEKFLTDPNRYGDARHAVDFWAYRGETFSPDDLLRVMPLTLPAEAKEKTLFLCLPYDEQPLSLEVTYVLPAERYVSTRDRLAEAYPSVTPEEGEYERLFIAYEAHTVIGERCVYYYCDDEACRVKLFVYDGNAAYVG
ncbi:MAG: hypothetical protein KIG36_00155 [Eubacteriales bacterium]|nr:hypothetical protein [Eubacteriales bacterium]